jgi:hypothetical protein
MARDLPSLKFLSVSELGNLNFKKANLLPENPRNRDLMIQEKMPPTRLNFLNRFISEEMENPEKVGEKRIKTPEDLSRALEQLCPFHFFGDNLFK